jgi:hypothetical protein
MILDRIIKNLICTCININLNGRYSSFDEIINIKYIYRKKEAFTAV